MNCHACEIFEGKLATAAWYSVYCPDQQSHPDRLIPVTPEKSRMIGMLTCVGQGHRSVLKGCKLQRSPLLAPECAVACVATLSVWLLASAAKEPTFRSWPHIGGSADDARTFAHEQFPSVSLTHTTGSKVRLGSRVETDLGLGFLFGSRSFDTSLFCYPTGPNAYRPVQCRIDSFRVFPTAKQPSMEHYILFPVGSRLRRIRSRLKRRLPSEVPRALK